MTAEREGARESKLPLEEHQREETFALDEMIGHIKRLLDEGVQMTNRCNLCAAVARKLGADLNV